MICHPVKNYRSGSNNDDGTEDWRKAAAEKLGPLSSIGVKYLCVRAYIYKNAGKTEAMGKREELQALPSEVVAEDGSGCALRELSAKEQRFFYGQVKKNLEEVYLFTIGRSRW